MLHEHFDATQVPHTRRGGWSSAAENVELATTLGDPVALGWALQDHGLVRPSTAMLDGGVRRVERMRRIGQEYGIGVFQRGPFLARAAQALKEGRLADAEALADEAFRVFTETGHRSAFAFYARAVLIPIRRDQGRLDELLPLLVQTPRPGRAAGDPAALCMVHADLDQPTEARGRPAHRGRWLRRRSPTTGCG